MPVASAMTTIHRDCLALLLTVNGQRYSLLYLEVKSQFP